MTQGAMSTRIAAASVAALLAVNASFLLIRVLLVYAIRGSYAERGWTFWLSWLADVPAAVRLTISTAQRPRTWRGRMYEPTQSTQSQHA